MDRLVPTRPARFGPAVVVGMLAVLLRLVVISAPPPDLFYGGQVWVEEWLRGNIATEVLAGPVIPLQDHQIPFWGGMLCIGLLAVPAFALLGPTLFALRWTTLPFAFLLAASAFLLLDRLVSRRAAWIGGVLLACTPPGFTFASVLAQGTHCEQTAIGVCLLWLYAEHRASGLSNMRLGFLVGLVFGFHVWFGAALVLPLVLLFDFASDHLFFLRREFAWRALGIVAGALPFLHYSFVYGGEPLANYGQGPVGMLTPRNFDAIRAKLASLPFGDLPTSFWFGNSHAQGEFGASTMAAVILIVLFIVALAHSRRALFDFARALVPWKSGRPTLDVQTLVLVWPFGWLVLYALTPFGLGPGEWIIDYRYLLPLQVFLLLAAAVALDVLAISIPRLRRVVVPLALVFAIVCASSAIARCDFAHARELRATPGARPEGVAKRLLWKHGSEPAALASFVEKVDLRRTAEQQDALYYELASSLRTWLAQSMRLRRAPTTDRDDPRAALQWAGAHVPARFRPYFAVDDGRAPLELPSDRRLFEPPIDPPPR